MRGGGEEGGGLLTPPLPSAGRGQARSSPGTSGLAPWGARSRGWGGSASTKLLTTLTVNVGEQGIKSAPDLRQES